VSNPKGKKKHPGFPVLIELISDAGPGVFMQTNNCPASLSAGPLFNLGDVHSERSHQADRSADDYRQREGWYAEGAAERDREISLSRFSRF